MQVRVFVTDDGSPEGTGPIVFVPVGLNASLPANPRLMPWRYFATIGDRDRLFAVHGPNAADALLIRGYFMVSNLAMA